MKLKGRTIWQYLCYWFRGSTEMEIWNPLKCKVTSRIALDLMNRRNELYQVQYLDEHVYRFRNKSFLITDYALKTDGPGLMIRTLQQASGDHESMLLELHHSTEYDQGLADTLKHESGELHWSSDGDEAVFWRVSDNRSGYTGTVVRHQDVDGDGKVQPDERQVRREQMWDFWRDTEDEAGNKVTEFLYVHSSEDGRDFRMWRGHIIPNLSITVI